MLIVAQRVSTIIDADQIIVLDDGAIVGRGRHEELLAQCPTYAEIVDSQFAGSGRSNLASSSVRATTGHHAPADGPGTVRRAGADREVAELRLRPPGALLGRLAPERLVISAVLRAARWPA